MPPRVNYERYQEQVNAFNQKYGVNFSYEKFERNMAKFRRAALYSGVGAGTISAEDSVYRGEFLGLYKQSAHSFIDMKIGKFYYADFLREFEELMVNYRTEWGQRNRRVPSVRGGWAKESDIVKDVKQKLANLKNEHQDDVEERYEKRELRIRDMRAYAHQLRDRGETSVEKIAALLVYANALENINNKRNFLWRATHIGRNLAEQKNAADIRAIASALIGDDTARLREAERILDRGRGRLFKEEVEMALNNTLKNEKREEERRPIEMENNKPPVQLRDFLEVGYRPNLAALDEEWEVVEPFYDAVIRQQKYWAEKTFENEVKKEIFQKNYIRLKLMKTVAEKYGSGTAKAAVDLYNKTEGAWAYQDSEFARLHPDYQPKIPAGYGDAAPLQNENNVDEKQANEPANDNPLRTSIVIEELGENDNRKDVSQRIEEQPTQSKEMAIE